MKISDLEKGILFEDTGNILFWNIDIENLSKIDNPTVIEDKNTLSIIWKNKIYFDGKKVDVKVFENKYR